MSVAHDVLNLFWYNYLVQGVLVALLAMHPACWESDFVKEFGYRALRSDYVLGKAELRYIAIHCLYAVIAASIPVVNGICLAYFVYQLLTYYSLDSGKR